MQARTVGYVGGGDRIALSALLDEKTGCSILTSGFYSNKTAASVGGGTSVLTRERGKLEYICTENRPLAMVRGQHNQWAM